MRIDINEMSLVRIFHWKKRLTSVFWISFKFNKIYDCIGKASSVANQDQAAISRQLSSSSDLAFCSSQVAYMITQKNAYFPNVVKIPHIYWSTSSNSNTAVLLNRKHEEQLIYNWVSRMQHTFNKVDTHNTYLHTGHFQLPRSAFNLRYDSRSKH
jgi:hypothetical protein